MVWYGYFLESPNSKIYGKVPQYNKTPLKGTNFASPWALRYIKVPLCICIQGKKGCGLVQNRVEKSQDFGLEYDIIMKN